MTILHINTVCSGSTGSIASDISDAARQAGHTCYIAYGQGISSDPKNFKIGGRFENKFHGLFYSRILGLQGYGTQSGTRRLLEWIDRIEPDIIHLHNLHGNYLNHPMLFRYIVRKEIPVVITLHDCYNFTGKCSHYTAAGCRKWQTGCRECPLVRRTIAPSYFFDRSGKIFSDKKKWYGRIRKMQVVAVSRWLEAQARESILAGPGHRIGCIYNWVDHAAFSRASATEIEAVKRKYGLSDTERYLISVGAGWDKNTSKFRDAQRLAERLPEGYRLAAVGGVADGTHFESPVHHIPYVSDIRELAALYSLATGYVHLSTEDTFGKVIAEAMACGTPPVVFDSTACPEVAGELGFVVAPHDTEAIVGLLPRLEISEERRMRLAEFVRTNYDYTVNTNRYLEIYNNI